MAGKVSMSSGTFYMADSLDLSSNYVWLQGAGRRATTLSLVASTNKDVIVNDAAAEYWNCILSDFRIYGNNPNNASGHGIKLTGARQHIFERLCIDGCSNAGIELIGTAAFYAGSCVIDKCVTSDNEEEGVYIGAYAYGCNINSLVSSGNATNIKIISGGEHRLAGCNLMQSTTVGLQVYTAYNVLISNTYSSDDTIDAFEVNRSSDVYLVNCFAEDTATNCFYIVGAAGAVSDNVHLLNCGVTTTGVTPTRGLYLLGVAGASRVITYFTAMGCNFSAATTPVSLSPSTVLNGTENIRGNQGYIAKGEVRTKGGDLTAGAVNTVAFYWNNPEKQDILVRKVTTDVTTASTDTGACIDIGIADSSSGTNLGTEFFDDLPTDATGINCANAMTLCEDSTNATDAYVVGLYVTEDSTKLVGTYSVEYQGR